MIRVLNVNVSDMTGDRFNNLRARHALADEGVESQFLVWNQQGHEPGVGRAFRFPGSRRLARAISGIEAATSRHADLHLQSYLLPMHAAFRQADVVHYHIIYDRYFSLRALPYLTRLKPSVWTFHDPWPMTGHCIYPMGCERWKSGCGSCPHLELPFPMRRDRTARQFKMKQNLLARSRLQVVVASQAMMRMTGESPIARGLERHLVPFGVDLSAFTPRSPHEARARLGVRPDAFVIAVRASYGPFKGYERFIAALEHVRSPRPISVITMDEPAKLDRHIGEHQIIDLGWVSNESLMRDIYTACDIFVMPSKAEAFGMMAIEAMASGRTVLATSDTGLPEIVFAPHGGVSVAPESEAIAAAISDLAADDERRRAIGERARQIACDEYDEKYFASRLAVVYRQALLGGRARTESGPAA